MNTQVRYLLIVVCVALALVSCSQNSAQPAEVPTNTPVAATTQEKLQFSGSTTVQPLAEKLAEVYRTQHPGLDLVIGAGGSRVGIQAVQEGTADIGMVSRELRDGEMTDGMEKHQIAIDVLAMIVHPSNSVEELSLEQLKDIYIGKITNWEEVGGDDMTIAPLIREVSSGTRGAFDEIVLEDESPVETEENTKITAGEVSSQVKETPGAIGYVGFGHLSGDEVKVLAIDGVVPSPEAAVDGTYKLKRPLNLLTGPLSREQAQEFIDFVLSDEGQQVVKEDGWVPVASK